MAKLLIFFQGHDLYIFLVQTFLLNFNRYNIVVLAGCSECLSIHSIMRISLKYFQKYT